MDRAAFVNEWTDIGIRIVLGGRIGPSELNAIYSNLDLGFIKPEYLPDENTVLGTTQNRKKAIFSLVQKLWGFTADDLLGLENRFLQAARLSIGSKETGGKDKLDDVVIAELFIRIIAAAKLVTEEKHDQVIVDEAVNALNLILGEACEKGRTRMIMVDGDTVYSILRKGGLMIGSGAGKFLPYPEKSLPYIFVRLRKELINSDAYKKSH